MGAVDESKGEDRERINSSRKIEDVLSAAVLNKIGAPVRVLSIEDDLWPQAQVTTPSVGTDAAVDGSSRPPRAFASSASRDAKNETSLSDFTEQGLSSDCRARTSIDSRVQQQTGSGKVLEDAVRGMGSSIIDRHGPCQTAVGTSVLATGGDPLPANTTKARVSFKQTTTGGTDTAFPPSQSTSEDDQLNGASLNQRRQKRMLSNRESARRSRLRKQQHLDELRAEVDQLQAEKTSMVANYNGAAEQFSQLTRENTALRKHAEDLYQKIATLKTNNDFATSNWWRALDIENGSHDAFAADHLSVYLQPEPALQASSQGALR